MKCVKKLLAFNLALLLLLSLLPVTALAANDESLSLELGVEQAGYFAADKNNYRGTYFSFDVPFDGYFRFQVSAPAVNPDGSDSGYPSLSLLNEDYSWRPCANLIGYPTAAIDNWHYGEMIAHLDAGEKVRFAVDYGDADSCTVVVNQIPQYNVYDEIPDIVPAPANLCTSDSNTIFPDWVVFEYTAPSDGVYSVDSSHNDMGGYGELCYAFDTDISYSTGSAPFIFQAGHEYCIFYLHSHDEEHLVPFSMTGSNPPLLHGSMAVEDMSNGWVKFSPAPGKYTLTLTNTPSDEWGTNEAVIRVHSKDGMRRVYKVSPGDAEAEVVCDGGDYYIYVQSSSLTDVLTAMSSGEGVASIPVVATNIIIYNGTMQHLFTDDSLMAYNTEGWEYTNGFMDWAIDAGSYTTMVAPKSGYHWADGTSGTKVYNWSIEPAPATVKVPNKVIYVGDAAPELDADECEIIGKVFDYHEIGDISLSYSGKPDTSTAGTVEINAIITNPNKNYATTVIPGTLNIRERNGEFENDDGSTTTTVTDPETGTMIETTIHSNGDKLVVEIKKDGSAVKTETKADGGKSETVIDSDGSSVSKATTAEGVQAEDIRSADGEVDATVILPDKLDAPVVLPIEPAPIGKTVITIDTEITAKIVVPVKKASSGTVVVIVHEDGTEEIVKKSILADGGIALTVDGSVKIKLVNNAKTFGDIKDRTWYSASVDFVSSREMLNGTDENTFSPDEQMTRAMLTTVLARFDGQDTNGGAVWYTKGQEWAKNNSISDGTKPDAFITREEMVTMLYRYAKNQISTQIDGENSASKFDDSGSISSWAKEGMDWAIHNRIINGKTSSSLDPQGLATRAEVSTILMRFCKLFAE